LFLGTNADNVADKVAKGRAALFSPKGEDHGCAKLSAEQVALIRHTYKRGQAKAFAERYGVHVTTIQRLVYGRSWAA
jgi:DNA-binding transcriptional regulator YiaG